MRKFIAIYELIGGIITLAMLLLALGASIGISTQMHQPWTATVIATIIVSFGFGLWLTLSGLMLMKSTRFGYVLSIIIQFIQMIIIQTPNFHYQFYAPIGLGATFGIPGLNYIYGLGASYTLSFSQQPVDAVYIGFNFISLIFFILLLVSLRKTNTK